MLPGEAPESFWYRTAAVVNCLRLLTQLICLALSFARDRAGSNMAARIAMMAITTSSSIKVKAKLRAPRRVKTLIIALRLAQVDGLRYHSIGLCRAVRFFRLMCSLPGKRPGA